MESTCEIADFKQAKPKQKKIKKLSKEEIKTNPSHKSKSTMKFI